MSSLVDILIYPGVQSVRVWDYERQILQETYESCGQDATRMAGLLKTSRQNFSTAPNRINLINRKNILRKNI